MSASMGGASDRIELFAVANSLPWLPPEPIGSFRRAHYPTGHLLAPHLTVVFPVSAAAIDGDAFRNHVRGVVSRTPAFDVRLTGLEKSWDHWLFLAVAQGHDEVVALHDALYTDILHPHLPGGTSVRLLRWDSATSRSSRTPRDPLELRDREFDRSAIRRRPPGGRGAAPRLHGSIRQRAHLRARRESDPRHTARGDRARLIPRRSITPHTVMTTFPRACPSSR